MRNASLNWFCAVGVAIALVATQPAFSQDKIEIVHFQSLTFPGSLFTPPFMPAPEDGKPATVFGFLRLPEGNDRVPAVVLTHAVQVSRERRRTGRAVSDNSASLRSWSIVLSGGASRAFARVLTPSAWQAS